MAKPTTAKKWIGSPPSTCDFCNRSLASKPFINGKIPGNRWGYFCLGCARVNKVQLGLGRGQLYAPDGEGGYIKQEG